MSVLHSMAVVAVVFLLMTIGVSYSTTDNLLEKRNLLLREGVINASFSPNDSCCCIATNCSEGLPTCAIDDDNATVWTLKPRTVRASIVIHLNASSLVSDVSVLLSPTSVIPSSIVVAALGMDVTWTTYFNQTCQPNDDYLRKRESQYYSCHRPGQFMTVLAPEGLFSIRNSSDGWLWWRTFHQFQLTIEASDKDYSNSSASNSIEIVDVRLYGWDEPENGCNCHPVGVLDANLPCFNGKCNCRNTKTSNIQCIPNIDFGLPTYGPISGGTISFSTGNYLAHVANITLGNNYSCIAVRNNETLLQIKTTAADDSDLHSSIPIRIYWDRPQGVGSFIVADWEFTYKPDPVINSISPLTSIKRGGISQTVRGENLDSVAYPFITLVFQGTTSDLVYANFTNSHLEDNDKFCHHINSTTLECIAPGTEEIQSYPNGKITITISVDISKYNDYKNCEFTNGDCDFQITENPSVYQWNKEIVYNLYNGKKSFSIQGFGFKIGSREEDYTVTVGGVRCQIVNIVTNNIVFYPPDSSNFTTIDDAKQTILAVGYYTNTVGYIQYYLNWIDNPSNRNALIIGLVCGVGGVVVIILAVVLIKSYHKRKSPPPRAPTQYEIDEVRYTRPPERDPNLLAYLSSEQRIKVERILVAFSRIQIDEEIGSGNFGKVYRGLFFKTDGEVEHVAIKTLLTNAFVSFHDKVSFLEEATIMIDFSHRNVLSLMAVVVENDLPYVVLPLMENGDLREFVSEPYKPITVCDLTSYCLQVAEGMEYLAENKFVHRDVAARNCMINKAFVVKVADFGLARDIFEKDYYRTQDFNRPLPVRWMAIECLSSYTKFTESSDVWSFGVLMWELFTRGRKPYADIDNLELKRFLQQGGRLEKSRHTPTFIYDLMMTCWKENPAQRPRFNEIVLQLKEVISYASESVTDDRKFSVASVDEAANVNQIQLGLHVDWDNRASYLDLMRQSVLPDD